MKEEIELLQGKTGKNEVLQGNQNQDEKDVPW